MKFESKLTAKIDVVKPLNKASINAHLSHWGLPGAKAQLVGEKDRGEFIEYTVHTDFAYTQGENKNRDAIVAAFNKNMQSGTFRYLPIGAKITAFKPGKAGSIITITQRKS